MQLQWSYYDIVQLCICVLIYTQLLSYDTSKLCFMSLHLSIFKYMWVCDRRHFFSSCSDYTLLNLTTTASSPTVILASILLGWFLR